MAVEQSDWRVFEDDPRARRVLGLLSSRYAGEFVKGDIQKTYDKQVEKSVVDYIQMQVDASKKEMTCQNQ